MDKIDLTGHKFNYLTVISSAGKNKFNQTVWNCQCDCGKFTIVTTTKIRSGYTKSCGCFRSNNRALDKGVASSKHLFNNYKNNARRRELDFIITFEEFLALTKKPCYYCGIWARQRIHPNKGNNRTTREAYFYNGLDRVDNSKGYTVDNVVTCCGTCNYAKRSMEAYEFEVWIKRVYQNIVTRDEHLSNIIKKGI